MREKINNAVRFYEAEQGFNMATKQWREYRKAIEAKFASDYFPNNYLSGWTHVPLPVLKEGEALAFTWAGLELECRFRYEGGPFNLEYGFMQGDRFNQTHVQRFLENGYLMDENGKETRVYIQTAEPMELLFWPGINAAIAGAWQHIHKELNPEPVAEP